MNFKTVATVILFSAFSVFCSDKKDGPVENEKITSTDSISTIFPESKSKFAEIEQSSTLNRWLKFYQKQNPDLNLNEFEIQNTEKLETMKGNVLGSFDPGFDSAYLPFLVYNPSKTMYLDLDSYNWILDENGIAMFEADQEVNLVNLKDKTVKRVAFFGPSNWVEDAFWVSDSKFVLLENTDENQTGFQIVDLESDSVQTYFYSKPLKINDEFYNDLRLKKNGIRVLR
jgi:hypothetical protein